MTETETITPACSNCVHWRPGIVADPPFARCLKLAQRQIFPNYEEIIERYLDHDDYYQFLGYYTHADFACNLHSIDPTLYQTKS